MVDFQCVARQWELSVLSSHCTNQQLLHRHYEVRIACTQTEITSESCLAVCLCALCVCVCVIEQKEECVLI